MCMRGDALRKDSNQVLVVGVADVLYQVLEFAGELGFQDMTVEVKTRVSRRSVGIASMLCSDLRFSRFGNAEDVGHAEVVQDFALHAGLERSNVEACSTRSLDLPISNLCFPRQTDGDLEAYLAGSLAPPCASRTSSLCGSAPDPRVLAAPCSLRAATPSCEV